jgi:microcystin-dependent protein
MPGVASSPYVGQIMMVGFNFPPQGWASCNGQLLAISEFDVLFNLIGTTYGGDGQTTFAVPDLRGRVPVGIGQGASLSVYTIGEVIGAETVTLTLNQIPQHQHSYNPVASQNDLTTDRPDSSYPAVGGYYATTANSAAPMAALTVASGGGSQPHNNLQPFLAINFIISLFGVFPSQN